MSRASAIVLSVLLAGVIAPARGGVFIFAESQNNPQLIAHPAGYSGNQNNLTVSVCIDPASQSISDMEIPVRNAITTWNELSPRLDNVRLNDPTIPSNHIDYESVLLHEIGHCVGLGHVNLATESGVASSNRGYAKSRPGPNGNYDLDDGADGVKGSLDDLRGDDINYGWFRKGFNSPFLHEFTVDETTYGTGLEDLPVGHNFVEIASLGVARARGLADGEAVMHQGTRIRENQRDLARDDATMVRLAMAGRDRTQETADDYRFTLEYGGVKTGCDITIRTEGSGFGVCQVSGSFISGDGNHIQITSGSITMGSTSNYNWYFNQSVRSGGSHSVGGLVSGLDGSGLVLQNNGGDDLPITGNGRFLFGEKLPSGLAFEVSVATQPVGTERSCSVSNGEGTIAGDDVGSVQITCQESSFEFLFRDRFEQPH